MDLGFTEREKNMTTMAEVAQQKFSKMVDDGRARAMRGMEALHAEYRIRRDYMAKPSGLDVRLRPVRGQDEATTPKASELVVDVKGGGVFTLTHHAQNQLLAAADVPVKFAETLREHELGDLLRYNIAKLLPKTSPDGLLIREVSGTVKGVLSPSYRTMDASPMFEAFISQAMQTGLVPHSGEVTDTRAFVQFLRPQVIEIFPGEHVVFGVELKNSDYGNGALDLVQTIWRLLCTNGAIGNSMFRKVHLGRRFDGYGEGDNVIRLSAKTVELDTKTMQSALHDTMKQLPAHIDATVETLRSVGGAEVKLTEAIAKLGKAGLKKATLEKVKALYETEQPVESLPSQPGAWRFSNVLSLLANSAQGDEAHDLREFAYSVLTPKAAA